MAKIALGGERLGTGGKMRINLPEFGRSSHDQGMVFTTDQAIGTLVPAYCNLATRGDTIYIDEITSLVRTLPTAGPVFGSFKQQIDVFVAPIRLYIGPLHNNATGIGLKMQEVKFPKKTHKTTVYVNDLSLKNPNIASVAPDSLGAYLGQTGSKIGGGFTNEETYKENSIFELFYWDIYKNYYANKQEEEGVVIKGLTPKFNYPYTNIKAKGWNDNGESITETTENTAGYQIFTQQFSVIPKGQSTNYTRFFIEIPTEYQETDAMAIGWGKTLAFVSYGQKLTNLTDVFDVWEVYRGGGIPTLRINSNTKTYTVYPGTGVGYANGVETGGNGITLQRFRLSNIDKMRERILETTIGEELITNSDTTQTGIPYNVETETVKDDAGLNREARSLPMCGLGVKTHLSDIFNNWLQTDWLDGDNGINDLTAIDVTSGSFTINEFIMDYKLFRMMNKVAISDGSYDAWQTAVYGMEGKVITESPIYCGGYSAEIAFDEVVSSAAAETEPLGSLAGRGATQRQTIKGGKGIKIKCDEASLIMVICSFTPRTTYSQFEDWWINLDSMNDLHKPDLDGIAFQDLLSRNMASFSEKINSDGSRSNMAVGKQPSWIEYTTNIDRTHGSFAAGKELEHMVLNRSYQASTSTGYVENATAYIDPTEFNVIFADEKLTNRPFWVQIAFNETSRRVMSASQIPML